LSHDEVKLAVGLFCGFVSAIASAASSFLYINNEYLILKKEKRKEKKKRQKKKKAPYILSSFSSALHPAIEISTP